MISFLCVFIGEDLFFMLVVVVDNSDSALHTQLWIDPAEEFLQYTHVGDAVDVTFGVKELKVKHLFLTFYSIKKFNSYARG